MTEHDKTEDAERERRRAHMRTWRHGVLIRQADDAWNLTDDQMMNSRPAELPELAIRMTAVALIQGCGSLPTG